MTRKDYVSTANILSNYALELGQGAFEDLVEYMNRLQQKQQAALERMASNARELGLEY